MHTSAKRRRMRPVAAGVLGAVLLAVSNPATAYNEREHERLPDQAYQLLNLLRRGPHLTEQIRGHNPPPPSTPLPLTERPPGVPASEQASWQRFITEASAAADKLDQISVDLPGPRNRRSDECGGFYPVTTGGPLADCRAGELTFAPSRFWGRGNVRCYLRRGYNFGDGDNPEVFRDVPSTMTGALLGYYAENVDDEADDTHMNFRITNTGIQSTVKDITARATELAIFLFLVPQFCLGQLLVGSPGSCLDDAADVAHQLEPTTLIDSVLPIGVGDIDGDDTIQTTGLWHFVTPNRGGRFNQRPGMHYVFGGLDGEIDALDLAIVATTDLTGLTINPDRSNGVSQYAPLADGPIQRRRSDWVSWAIGHVEFEPLDNLALFGVNQFKVRSGARGLGWPLHAIGDAVQPHHTISATGWGHAQWEKFAELTFEDMFNNRDRDRVFLHYFDFPAIMAEAWRWWKFLEDNQTGPDLPIRAMIEALAVETLASPGAVRGRIFKPGILAASDGAVRALFGPEQDAGKALLSRGIGATMAFLVKATVDFPASPSGTTPCSCPAGQARYGVDAAGTVKHSADCVACGTGVFTGMAFSASGQCVVACPADKPLANGTTCVATCPAGATCTGVKCPADRPFVDNGSCVASCPAVVVNRRECASNCPAGQAATSSTFCIQEATPLCPGQGSAQGDGQSCCRPRAAACTSNEQCCSLSCTEDGICRGRTGEACRFGADCISGFCNHGTCGPGDWPTACISGADCRSGSCRRTAPTTAGSCRSSVGGGCNIADDCVNSVCGCSGPECTPSCCLVNETACTADTECCSGFCSGGTCQNRIIIP